MHVTRDGGKTWANVTPKEMPDFGRVSQIDASAFEPGAAYVAVKKPLLDDLAPYIFRTHDFGKTWTKIVTGIRPNDYVHVGPRRSDAPRPALRRHAARRLRVVRRRRRWESLSLNLPDTPVSDLIVEANSTRDRDARPRASTSSTTSRRCGSPERSQRPAADAVLFKPADAIRRRRRRDDRVLLRKPAEKLTIDILDARGQVVRTFAGGAAPAAAAAVAGAEAMPAAAAPAAEAPAVAAGQGAAAQQPAAAAAPEETLMHRLAAVAAAAAPPTAPMAAGLNSVHVGSALCAGDEVPGHGAVGRRRRLVRRRSPGTYQVRLTVDGKPQTQPLVVKRHPLRTRHRRGSAGAVRSRDPDSRQGRARRTTRSIQIRKIKEQVKDRLAKSSDAQLKAGGRPADRRT